MKKLLLIDCYDSFTDILAQTLSDSANCSVVIEPWDTVDMQSLSLYDGIILSPGPGIPYEYASIFGFLDCFKEKPVLGVCMGHQILGVKCGAKLKHLSEVYHGQKTYLIKKNDSFIMNGINENSPVGLYHSWVIGELPSQFLPIAFSKEGYLMIMQHEQYPWLGFQFHPESYMTVQGKILLANWINNI